MTKFQELIKFLSEDNSLCPPCENPKSPFEKGGYRGIHKKSPW